MALERNAGLERESWRQRAWGVVLDHRWTGLAILWVVAFGLGMIGFQQYAAAEDQPRTLADLIYLSLQLFVLESGAVFGPSVTWHLELARFLAPAVTLVSLYQAISKIVGEQLNRARTWGLTGHVVIAGLGERGALLAKAHRDAGKTVLVVERQPSAEALEQRERGVLVLIGDATSPAIQRRARIREAATLIAVTGDDGTNAEIARTAREVSRARSGRHGRLDCVVHILDVHLWSVLRRVDLGQHERFQVQFVNLFQIGALELLADAAVRTVHAQSGPAPTPHVVIVGAGWFGQNLAMRAARLWQDQPRPADARMRITLIDRAATARKAELLSRYPQIAAMATVEAVPLEVPAPDLERPAYVQGLQPDALPTEVYVCLSDDTRGMQAGLALQAALAGTAAHITVRTRRRWGVAGLAAAPVQAGAGTTPLNTSTSHLHVFPLLESTCRPMLAQSTALNDVLARLIHAEYLRLLERQNQQPEDKPNMRPWDALTDEARGWNHSQAAHIPVKLALLGCRAVPTPEWDVPLYVISPADIERLAILEHQRWMQERLDAGWTRGDENNPARPNPTNPHLVPWEQLHNDICEYDRTAVEGIPAFLARAGYRVEKI